MPRWTQRWIDSLNHRRSLERQKEIFQTEQFDIWARLECNEDQNFIRDELKSRWKTLESQIQEIDREIESL